MRWERLFADLEAQADAVAANEFDTEVAERTRIEVGKLRLVDRLRPAAGHPVQVSCKGAGLVGGRLDRVGADWLLLVDDLRHALRGIVRDRAPVQAILVDGATLGGTFDRVGADFVELAEHPRGEPRRATAVRRVHTMPLAALATVRTW